MSGTVSTNTRHAVSRVVLVAISHVIVSVVVILKRVISSGSIYLASIFIYPIVSVHCSIVCVPPPRYLVKRPGRVPTLLAFLCPSATRHALSQGPRASGVLVACTRRLHLILFDEIREGREVLIRQSNSANVFKVERDAIHGVANWRPAQVASELLGHVGSPHESIEIVDGPDGLGSDPGQ